VRHDQGKRWPARWTDHGGETRAKSFERKADAQRHVTNITAAITTGTYADPQRSVITFAEISARWLAAKGNSIKPATYAEYRSVLEGVVLPKWGEARLRDIDHADIQEWVSWLSVDPAARTRRARTELPGALP
jgi:hypothetical protein